ncbi:hypothetical protein [Gimesia maris]|uniref:hypothetical protein n=1 Tax=Gimesia maris TaxID=122 RepID=UPI00241C71FF|nr:hypothetical protein [Gimesia maris]|tara:strand:+ start:44657 stop:45112 length:456 start_codon:yes stop_codon:yes gene_type:complete
MKSVAGLAVLLVWAAVCTAAEPAPEEDYELISGIWVRNDHDAKGSPLRVEQELTRDFSKVTVYDRLGRRIHHHQAKYRLQRMDDASLFIYYDLEVLEGPNKGRKSPAPQSFIYRVKDDRFIQVEGILNGDKLSPKLMIWWKNKLVNPPRES